MKNQHICVVTYTHRNVNTYVYIIIIEVRVFQQKIGKQQNVLFTICNISVKLWWISNLCELALKCSSTVCHEKPKLPTVQLISFTLNFKPKYNIVYDHQPRYPKGRISSYIIIIIVTSHERQGVSNHYQPKYVLPVCSGEEQKHIRDLRYWSLVRRIHQWTVESTR